VSLVLLAGLRRPAAQDRAAGARRWYKGNTHTHRNDKLFEIYNGHHQGTTSAAAASPAWRRCGIASSPAAS
jgi:hypothetical protein